MEGIDYSQARFDPAYDDEGDESSSWGGDSDDDDDNQEYGHQYNINPSRRGEGRAKGEEGKEGGHGFSWADGGPLEEMQRQHAILLEELHEQKKKNHQLGIALEAMEPIPGMDAGKFLEAAKATGEAEGLDYRDSKIVHLAKKCRNLRLALEQYKVKHARAWKELQELRATTSSSNNSSRPSSSTEHPIPGGEGEEGRARQQQQQARPDMTASLHKQVGELRVKLEQSSNEVKRLMRVLSREVGEGPALDKALSEEGSWRGRAQQIIMLKTKVKKLEESRMGDNSAGASPLGVAGAIETTSSNSSSSANPTPAAAPSRSIDVDKKAMEGLQNVEQERARSLEQSNREKRELQSEVQALKKKLEASKARSSYLEADVTKYKDHIRFLLKKATNDDELIRALRSETTNLLKERRVKEQQQGPRRQVKYKPGEHKSEERKEVEKAIGLSEADLMLACRAEDVRPEDVIRKLKVKLRKEDGTTA